MKESGSILVAMLENHISDMIIMYVPQNVQLYIWSSLLETTTMYHNTIYTYMQASCVLLFRQIREDGPDCTFPWSEWVDGWLVKNKNDAIIHYL